MVDLKIGAATTNALTKDSPFTDHRAARQSHAKKYEALAPENKTSTAGREYRSAIEDYSSTLQTAEKDNALSQTEHNELRQQLLDVEENRVPAQVAHLTGDSFTADEASDAKSTTVDETKTGDAAKTSEIDTVDKATDVYHTSGKKTYREGPAMQDVLDGKAVFQEGDKNGGSTEFQTMLKDAGYDIGEHGADGFQGPDTWGKGVEAWKKDAGFEGDAVTGDMLKDLKRRGVEKKAEATAEGSTYDDGPVEALNEAAKSEDVVRPRARAGAKADPVESYNADKAETGGKNYIDGAEPGQVAQTADTFEAVREGDVDRANREGANLVGRVAENAAITVQSMNIEERTGHENVSQAGEALREAVKDTKPDVINDVLIDSTPQEARRATELAGGSGKFADLEGVRGDNSDYRDAAAVASNGAHQHLSDADAKAAATKIRNADGWFNDDEAALNQILTVDDNTLRRMDQEVISQGKPAGISQMIVETTRPGAHRDLLMKRLEKIGSGEHTYQKWLTAQTNLNGMNIAP